MPDFHRLDPDADAAFLRRSAADPLSRVGFLPTNAVAMCATCGLVSLRETWEACGGCPNGHATAAPWNAAEAARASGDGSARAVAPPAFAGAPTAAEVMAEPAPDRRTGLWVALGLAALVAVGTALWLTRDREPAPAAETPTAAQAAAPQSVAAEIGETEGELGDSDFRTPDGYYQDLYVFAADSSGRTLTFTAESDTFYPDLVVTAPDGRQLEAETILGDGEETDLRRVSVRNLRGAGTYRVLVSSRRPAATGAYTLRIVQEEPVVALPTNGSQVQGEFTRRSTQADGRYRATYSFSGTAQREHTITVRSGAFTPTIAVTGPNGNVRGTSAPTSGATVFRFTPEQAGTYRVVVSTAEAGRTGTYAISLVLGPPPPATPAAPDPGAAAAAGGTLRAGGAAVRDSLAAGDTRTYGASGRIGDRVTVEVRAQGFTPTVTVIGPDGTRTSGASDGDRARARVTLPADGRFRVVVGSAGGSGTYSVSLEQAAGVTAAPIPRLPGADVPRAPVPADPSDIKPPVEPGYTPQPLGTP